MKLYYFLLMFSWGLSAQINVVPQPNEVRYHKGTCAIDTPITYLKDAQIAHPEGYQLLIQPKIIVAKYATEAGKYYAEQTLKQLNRMMSQRKLSGKKRTQKVVALPYHY